MGWSYDLHLGWGIVVCGLDIENTENNIIEQVSNVIPQHFSIQRYVKHKVIHNVIPNLVPVPIQWMYLNRTNKKLE